MVHFQLNNMSLAALQVIVEKCKRNNVDYVSEVKTNHRYNIVIYVPRSKWNKMA